MAILIDGKEISQQTKDKVKSETEALFNNTQVRPGLAVIRVGEDPASKIYVSKKEKMCSEVGFHSEMIVLEESTSEKVLITKIGELNRNGKIHGILVQLPLPKHIDEGNVLAAIDPMKDVDGFHSENMGSLFSSKKPDENLLVPCTPKGIIKLIDSTGTVIEGKNAVVIGRSNIVGKPIAKLLLDRNATVTICHSRTKNLAEICRRADILVSAIGVAKFIKDEMVKEGAVVIDVGMNRDENENLCGDVDFGGVMHKASYITPVPRGVGPMTVAMLMENTLLACKKQLAAKSEGSGEGTQKQVLKMGILASTKGSDMQAIIEEIDAGRLDAEISVVISNKEDAFALERARNHNLKAIFLDGQEKSREEYDREMDKVLEDNGVELILLIGYMKLMSSWFVQKWLNKVMNIHPSLLPAYAGGMDLNVHEEVLRRGCKISGCSLIFIDEGADTGPLILQKAVHIEENESPQSLKDKVQRAEQDVLIEGIKLFAEGRLRVEGSKVRVV